MTDCAELNSRQSSLIKAMRFPLIVMVLFVHSPGAFPTSTIEWSAGGQSIYHFVAELFSGHLCAIATRWFFLLSGFLFFYYLKDGEFSWAWVKAKWGKRIHSLLIPYLIWNALATLAVIVKNALFSSLFSLGRDPNEWDTVIRGPLYWFWTGPADFPLWFLRDLIVMSLFAPALYWCFKRFKWFSLGLLALVGLLPWSLPFLSLQALFFFGLGVWLSTHNIGLLSQCRCVKIPAAIIAMALLVLATTQVGRPLHPVCFRAFLPFGMISFMNFCDSLIDNEKWQERLCNLSASVFFIYAAHEIYILGWTKGLCLRLFGDSLAGTWISYWLVPLIVLTICLGLYYLFARIMPHTLSFICGGRSK